MNDRYELVDGTPVPCNDLQRWSKALERDKIMKKTFVRDVLVSTVFLGVDHSFGGAVPILFETMVFPAKDNAVTDWGELDQARYTNMADALLGHDALVAKWSAPNEPARAQEPSDGK